MSENVPALLIREAPAPVPVRRIQCELAIEDEPVRQSTIIARIKSLRQKLGRDRIEMRPRFGYAFVRRTA